MGAGPQAGGTRSSLGPGPQNAVETGGHSCVKASVQKSIGLAEQQARKEEVKRVGKWHSL